MMGSLARQLKRNQLRQEFNVFTKQWHHAKMFQQQQIDSGETIDPKEKMGRKPSFGMFIKRMKAAAAMEKIQGELKVQEMREGEKKIDLEWKEE